MAKRTFPYVAVECAFGFDPGLVQIAYQQEVLRDLPQGYYRLAEAASPFADLSLYAQPSLALTGAATLAQAGLLSGDTADKSIQFAGGAANGTYLSGGDILRQAGAFTVEFWYRHNQVGAYANLVALVSKADGTTAARNYGTWVVNTADATNVGRILFQMYNTLGTVFNLYSASRVDTNGLVTHVAVSCDGTTMRIYVNGVLENSLAFTGTPYTGADAFRVGAMNTNYGAPVAYLDEVAVYPRAVSAARLAAHYAARVRANPASDLASLPFANITRQVKQAGTSRGRQHELNRMESGTAQLLLDNTDRRFEPEYAGDLVNLVTNPSFELDTAGWTNTSLVSMARDQTRSRYGGYSLKCVGDADADRCDYALTLTAGQTYTFSGWLYIEALTAAGVTVRVADNAGAGPGVFTLATISGVGGWQRFALTFVAASSTSHLFQVRQNGAGAATFYLDGVQIENAAAASDYCDGDLDNCRWAGTRHASTSYRGGPYYPNVVPMRRTRLRAAWPAQLVPNGSFERSTSSLAPWTATVAGAATITNDGGGDALAAPGWARRAAFASPAGGATDDAHITSDYIPVDELRPYTLSAYFYKTGAGNPYTVLRLHCFDDERNFLGRVAPAVIGGDGSFSLNAQNVWEKWGGVVQAGTFMPGTKYVCVVIYGIYGPGRAYTGTVYVDAVALTPGGVTFPDGDYYALADYDANDAWDELYNGYAEGWVLEWPSYRRGHMQVSLVDGFEPLALANLAVPMPQHLSGTRAAFVLDAAGWPRSERSLQAGQSQVQVADFANNLTQPATHLGDVADTEGGVAFVDRAGRIRFEDRADRITGGSHAISLVTFGDGGPATGELPYVDLTPGYGVEQVYNRVLVTRIGGVEQAAEDATSQQQYWRRELSKTGTWHISDGEAAAVAGVLLNRYKQPGLRADAITIEPMRDKTLWAPVIAREISDRITVIRRPQATTNGLIRAVHIEHISHDFTLGDTVKWHTEFQLSPADTQQYWLLGTSALGTDTRLSL